MKRFRHFHWIVLALICLGFRSATSNLRPLRFQPLMVSADRVEITLTGEPATGYVVESSPDLILWRPLSSGVLTNGIVQLFDPTLQIRRFYRARAVTTGPPPTNLVTQIDADRNVALFLTEDGGQADILLANGGTLTLSAPTNSVLTPQWVTVSPVTNIFGLPFSGGLIAAVLIEPDDLDLFGAAVLQVPLPGEIDRRRLVSFTCDSDGMNLALTLDRVWTNHLAIPVTHAGIFGCALATTQEIATVLQQHIQSQLLITEPRRKGDTHSSPKISTALICFPEKVVAAYTLRAELRKEFRKAIARFEAGVPAFASNNPLGLRAMRRQYLML